MVTMTIDGRQVSVTAGTTILMAARLAGIEIPTLCYRDGVPAVGSCMVCAVKLVGTHRYLPACSARVEPEMAVESETAEVATLRRRALEYLLSDHLGDCEAICRRSCPAGMDIPRMLAEVAEGRWVEAAAVVKERLALPGILGRVCHRPCERVCRRAGHDETVAIRRLEREVADRDRAAAEPHRPAHPARAGRVAVIGSGPSGLSAAWHLARLGWQVTVYEREARLGGSLRTDYPESVLPTAVVDGEIALIARLGVVFRCGSRVAPGAIEADALVWATGPNGAADATGWRTGRLLHPEAELVRRVADGWHTAMAVHVALGGSPEAPPVDFRSVLHRLDRAESAEFAKGLCPEPAIGDDTMDEAALRAEAERCGQCTCSVADVCQLRALSARYQARQRRLAGEARFARRLDLPYLSFEPGKCILCGQCVRVARAAAEPMDLAIQERGFASRIAAGSAQGSPATAAACIAICPTGALKLKAKGAR